VAAGRNIALLVEVAARNQLLREGGYDAAKRFVERVDELVASPPRQRRHRGARGRR
jgi:HPr kinase/phosphorylase